jgi:RNA polymerase sigma factor (sigma-70 family)
MSAERTLSSVMATSGDESGLWELARHNDGDAFAALFELHRDRVYHRALGLVGTVHDAEDVTAAAFFELWRKRGSVRVVAGSVLPWLLVTTVNLSRNVHRSTARYRRFLVGLPRADSSPGPDLEHLDTRDRLASSLRKLQPVDAALFVLTVLEDVPLIQAADTVGLRPATARVRLHRARARLRDELRDLNPSANSVPEGTGA